MGGRLTCCKGGATATPLAGDLATRRDRFKKQNGHANNRNPSAILSSSTTMTGLLPSSISGGTLNGALPTNAHSFYVIDTDALRSPDVIDCYTSELAGSTINLQHISERELDDFQIDPSLNPVTGPLFVQRQHVSTTNKSAHELNVHPAHKRRSVMNLLERPMKKSSSCSTIYMDDSTVSKPSLKTTIKCVSLAIYNLIRNRSSSRSIDIFDERLNPLTKENGFSSHSMLLNREPDQRAIYRFIRNLFNASQLSSECAIVTLVYLERLLTYAELDLTPATWKRTVLGAIMLASKVWDDQAVWNVDYCQILKDVSVENMNELERTFLELIQFNINVPSSVYAKYYFDLRTLADENDLTQAATRLTLRMAQKLEAMNRTIVNGVTITSTTNSTSNPAASSSNRDKNPFSQRRFHSMESGLETESSRSMAVLS